MKNEYWKSVKKQGMGQDNTQYTANLLAKQSKIRHQNTNHEEHLSFEIP